MKKLISASAESVAMKYGVSLEKIIVIDVVLEEVTDASDVAASERPEAKTKGKSFVPFERPDGSIDAEALADYKDFITDVDVALDYYNCEVLKQQPSLSTESQYFYFYGTDKDGNRLEAYLIVLRISEHDRDAGLEGLEGEELGRKRRQRKDALEKRIVKLTGEPIPIYKLREILFGDKGYKTYNDALDRVHAILRDISPI